MKRQLLLTILPVFALTGCVSKISNEEALKRISEISKKSVSEKDFYKSKFVVSKFEECKYTNSKINEYSYVKEESESLIEIIKDKKYIHVVDKRYAKTFTEFNRKRDAYFEEKYQRESWFYVKDKFFYAVDKLINQNISDSKQWEHKTYFVSKEEEASYYFNSNLGIYAGIMLEFLGNEVSSNYLAIASSAFSGNSKYSFTPYSGGEGSLLIKGSFKTGQLVHEDTVIKTDDSKLDLKVEWTNYKLNLIDQKLNCSAKVKDESFSDYQKLNAKVYTNPSNRYPDLKSYEKK